jgi:hypothetical protein
MVSDPRNDAAYGLFLEIFRRGNSLRITKESELDRK